MSLLDVLGSTPRLKILQALCRDPMYVSELAETVGMDGKTAVHHLSVLEDENIIEPYWEGNRKYYQLVKRVEFMVSPPPHRRFVAQQSEPALVTQSSEGDS